MWARRIKNWLSDDKNLEKELWDAVQIFKYRHERADKVATPEEIEALAIACWQSPKENTMDIILKKADAELAAGNPHRPPSEDTFFRKIHQALETANMLLEKHYRLHNQRVEDIISMVLPGFYTKITFGDYEASSTNRLWAQREEEAREEDTGPARFS